METQDPARWPRATLFAFRLAFVYLVLYNLPFPFGPFALPHTESISDKYQFLWHHFVPWVGKHLLHLRHEITNFSNGSGDTTYDYVLFLCYLALALAAAVLWSFLDRSRSDYRKIHQWLRLYIRLSVGAALLSYGAAKIFQQQFHSPTWYELLGTYGESSPMDLLWTFMGASRGYCIFAGCVEVLGGILLFVPRLTTLGGLLGIVAMSNVFAINLLYDVPVKLYSLHLLLMCAFLVLPDARRLADFLILNRAAEPAAITPLFSRNRRNASALLVQLLLGAFLFCSDLYQSHGLEKQEVASRPPFYGIWAVDEFTLSGIPLPPLLTDQFRWQRMIFQFPKGVGIQSMNGEWTGYWLHRDMEKKTFNMDKPNDPKKKFAFTFSSLDPQSLILDGSDGANQIRVKLHRVDEKQFALLGPVPHWVHEDADY
jgi:uncharacterized membrane protein YphA (DoxX/SURF4 family)